MAFSRPYMFSQGCTQDSTIRVIFQRGNDEFAEELTINIAFKNACATGRMKLAEWLLRGEPNVNHEDMGSTPLTAATRNGHSEMVKFICRNKADLNRPDMSGMTALHIAAVFENLVIASFLIKMGASWDRKYLNKHTPADLAKAIGHKSFGKLLKDKAKKPGVLQKLFLPKKQKENYLETYSRTTSPRTILDTGCQTDSTEAESFPFPDYNQTLPRHNVDLKEKSGSLTLDKHKCRSIENILLPDKSSSLQSRFYSAENLSSSFDSGYKGHGSSVDSLRPTDYNNSFSDYTSNDVKADAETFTRDSDVKPAVPLSRPPPLPRPAQHPPPKTSPKPPVPPKPHRNPPPPTNITPSGLAPPTRPKTTTPAGQYHKHFNSRSGNMKSPGTENTSDIRGSCPSHCGTEGSARARLERKPPVFSKPHPNFQNERRERQSCIQNQTATPSGIPPQSELYPNYIPRAKSEDNILHCYVPNATTNISQDKCKQLQYSMPPAYPLHSGPTKQMPKYQESRRRPARPAPPSSAAYIPHRRMSQADLNMGRQSPVTSTRQAPPRVRSPSAERSGYASDQQFQSTPDIRYSPARNITSMPQSHYTINNAFFSYYGSSTNEVNIKNGRNVAPGGKINIYNKNSSSGSDQSGES